MSKTEVEQLFKMAVLDEEDGIIVLEIARRLKGFALFVNDRIPDCSEKTQAFNYLNIVAGLLQGALVHKEKYNNAPHTNEIARGDLLDESKKQVSSRSFAEVLDDNYAGII